MNFVNSSVEIIEQGNTIIDGFKHIEKAARNCYRSEDKIDETSYEKILDVLKTNHHYSPLEHFTIYIKISRNQDIIKYQDMVARYLDNCYSRVNYNDDMDTVYITTNFRVIVENDWHDDLQYMCTPENYHAKRTTVKVVCSIGVSREWNRHRKNSICETSTRYCNYSKGKFGSEITYVIPQWVYACRNIIIESGKFDSQDISYLSELTDPNELMQDMACLSNTVDAYCNSLECAQEDYMHLLSDEFDYKLKPQEARGVLPLDTATTVFYTAYNDDWEYFITLRSSVAAHPDIRVLAGKLKQLLK